MTLFANWFWIPGEVPCTSILKESSVKLSDISSNVSSQATNGSEIKYPCCLTILFPSLWKKSDSVIYTNLRGCWRYSTVRLSALVQWYLSCVQEMTCRIECFCRPKLLHNEDPNFEKFRGFPGTQTDTGRLLKTNNKNSLRFKRWYSIVYWNFNPLNISYDRPTTELIF